MNSKLLIIFCAVFGIVFLLIGINWLHIPVPHMLINLAMIYSVPALSLPEKL